MSGICRNQLKQCAFTDSCNSSFQWVSISRLWQGSWESIEPQSNPRLVNSMDISNIRIRTSALSQYLLPSCSITDQLVEYVFTSTYFIKYVNLGQLEKQQIHLPQKFSNLHDLDNRFTQIQEFLLYYWHIGLNSVSPGYYLWLFFYFHHFCVI